MSTLVPRVSPEGRARESAGPHGPSSERARGRARDAPTTASEPATASLEDLESPLPGEFHKWRTVVCRLSDGAWHTISELVWTAAASRRFVERVLDHLGSWIESSDDRLRLDPRAATHLAERLGCSGVTAPESLVGAPLQAREAESLVRQLQDVKARLPRRRELDHVVATAETCVRRALFLDSAFDLRQIPLLFLGDHDLTSLAVAFLRPEAQITVVDVDEQVLEVLTGVAAEQQLALLPLFADLRLQLPPTAVGSAAVVFTDPPYTPAGIGLFLERSLEALDRSDFSRILLCYGFNEFSPSLGYKVQAVLHSLRLASEAILPNFNRYEGAEAIGSASALYVCRPTPKSWSASTARSGARVYTHGRAAQEGVSEDLPDELLTVIEQWLDLDDADPVFIGEGWPNRGAYANRVQPLDSWVREARSGRTSARRTEIVNLFPYYRDHLLRIPLMSRAKRVVIVAEGSYLGWSGLGKSEHPRLRFVTSKYLVAQRYGAGHRKPGAVMLEERDPPEPGTTDAVLRHVADRPQAKLGNAWREGLIAAGRRRGWSLTKKEAARLTQEATTDRRFLSSYLPDVPLGAAAAAADDIASSIELLVAGPPEGGQWR